MTLESFDFAFNPSINPKRIKSLASCRFMERGEGVFFPACRQAGSVLLCTGKTHLGESPRSPGLPMAGRWPAT